MVPSQPTLLKNRPHKPLPTGPIFEFGPGWGTKTKKWFKKYVLGGKCTLCRATRYVLLFGVIILLFGGPQLKQYFGKHENNQTLTGQIKITEIVQTGDSRIKLARRALADYLAQFPDPALSNGQKVYIETSLGQEIADDIFRAGATIELAVEDLKSAIENSKSLTPSQLERWEAAAQGVKF